MDLSELLSAGENVKNELFHGLCQCCLSEERLQNMLQSFLYAGTPEIYADMLYRCFSIEVQSNDVNIESLYLICEPCIEQLRSSLSFRLQVEKAQSLFHHTSLADSVIKIELSEVKEDKFEQAAFKENLCKPNFHKTKIQLKKIKNNTSKLSKIKQLNRSSKIMKNVRRDIPKKILKSYTKDKIKSMTKNEYKKLYNKVYNSELIPFKLDKQAVTCLICEETFRFHKGLIDHMRVHYPNFVCDVCGKSFVTKKTLVKHIQRHDNSRIPCRICNKLLKKSTLGDHIKRHTGVKARNKCAICSESFEGFYKRQEHMEKVHSIVKPRYLCKLCPKSFGYSSALSAHVRRFHLEEKNFACLECGQEFFCRKSFNEHALVHSKERNFQCGICFKSYGRKTTLNQHMKIHGDIKQHICPVCGRTFTQKCTLICHLKVHEKTDDIIITYQN